MTSKQDHQRWIYITIDHLTIRVHMKRFEQNNQLAQSDWEVGPVQSWLVLVNIGQFWLVLVIECDQLTGQVRSVLKSLDHFQIN